MGGSQELLESLGAINSLGIGRVPTVKSRWVFFGE